MRRTRLGQLLSSADVFAVSASQFGVDPDLPDNSAPLQALRSWLFVQDRPIPVAFPPGIVRYQNNRWLADVKYAHLIGQGTILQCTSQSATDQDRRPLNNYTPFHKSSGVGYGERFTQIDKRIIETTPGYVSAGDRLLLYGFDQQFVGFPPNARYFDFTDVASVSSGTVTLQRPLQHAYLDAWRDTVGTFGKPRVINCDTCFHPLAECLIFDNLEFDSRDGATLVSGRHVEYRRCVFHKRLVPSISQDAVISDCEIKDTLEVDKLLTRCLIERSTVHGQLAGATGCNLLIVDKCRLLDTAHVSPRVLHWNQNVSYLRGTAVTGLYEYSFHGFPTQYATIRDSVWHLDDETSAWRFDLNPTFTIDGSDGTALLVNDIQANRTNTIKRIMVGTTLVGTGKHGTVTSITHNGTQWVIAWTGPAPSPAEQFSWWVTEHLNQSGNVVDGVLADTVVR